MATPLIPQGSHLRLWPVLLAIVAVLAVQGLAIAIGGWHFWRYVAAPRLGVLSEADRWEESLRVATSAFRTLDEKQAALAVMLSLEKHAATLSDETRHSVVQALDNVVLMVEYPLDLKYAAARVQAMLGRGPTYPATRPVESSASGAGTAAVASPALAERRLQALVDLRGEPFREASAERTRLLVESFRRDPCAPLLAERITALERRDDLGTVERSFLYGMREERRQRCF